MKRHIDCVPVMYEKRARYSQLVNESCRGDTIRPSNVTYIEETDEYFLMDNQLDYRVILPSFEPLAREMSEHWANNVA